MSTTRKSGTKKKSEEIQIPDRLYFRIGEVSRICQLPAYVLRFWETEFPQFKPTKSSTGQRMYRRREVESVVRIKQLLYAEGYTIAGARQFLKSENTKTRGQSDLPFVVPTSNNKDGLKRVRQQLQEILSRMSSKSKTRGVAATP